MTQVAKSVRPASPGNLMTWAEAVQATRWAAAAAVMVAVIYQTNSASVSNAKTTLQTPRSVEPPVAAPAVVLVRHEVPDSFDNHSRSQPVQSTPLRSMTEFDARPESNQIKTGVTYPDHKSFIKTDGYDAPLRFGNQRNSSPPQRVVERDSRNEHLSFYGTPLPQPAQPVESREGSSDLEHEFNRDLTEIKKLLISFISDGRTYRQSCQNECGPMSLSFLKCQGALRPTTEGRLSLLSLVYYGNDRPVGSLPRCLTAVDSNGCYSHPNVDRAQELLLKYGKLLVEKGMLEP